MADVRLTATNPLDSSVVPVACNEKGELLLEEPQGNDFIGDVTIDGQLGIGTDAPEQPLHVFSDDKSNLAAFESAQDTANIRIKNNKAQAYLGVKNEGDFYVGTPGGPDLTVSSTGNIWIGQDQDFASSSPGSPSSVLQVSGTNYAGTSASINHWQNSSGNCGFLAFNKSRGASAGLFSPASLGDRLGGISFGAASDTAFDLAFEVSCSLVGRSDNNQPRGELQFKAFGTGGGTLNTVASIDPTGLLYTRGGADLDGDVIVASRNKKWLIVEQGGVAMLVEQTRSGEEPLEQEDPPAVRNLAAEVTMLELQLQKVMERLKMAPEAGWEVWDGEA